MKKYGVVVIRYGYIEIEAENETEAMRSANYADTDDVNWSDDWESTNCEEVED